MVSVGVIEDDVLAVIDWLELLDCVVDCVDVCEVV